MIRKFTGFALAAGGTAWGVKAVVILGTGYHVPFLFEVAPLLFAAGALGLHAHLARVPGLDARVVRPGGVLAAFAFAFALADAAGRVLFPTAVPAGASDFRVLGLVRFAGMLALLGALVALGVPARRERALPGRARHLPLALGVATMPLIMLGGVLSTLNERLLELPLVVLGAAWVALGAALARVRVPALTAGAE